MDPEGLRGQGDTQSSDVPPDATHIPSTAPHHPSDRSEISLEDPGPRQIESRVLTLSTWASTDSDTPPEAGEAGIDLAISLRRLMSWFGEGWEEIEADGKGRRL